MISPFGVRFFSGTKDLFRLEDVLVTARKGEGMDDADVRAGAF